MADAFSLAATHSAEHSVAAGEERGGQPCPCVGRAGYFRTRQAFVLPGLHRKGLGLQVVGHAIMQVEQPAELLFLGCARK